jgi:hypothetical protein
MSRDPDFIRISKIHRVACLLFLFSTPAFSWQPMPHEAGIAHRIEGRKISGAAETGSQVYILIEPQVTLPKLDDGPTIAFRNVIFNYGDSYVCGWQREVKVTVDGELLRETEPTDGQTYDWHIFNKGFFTTHYGEVLTLESFATDDGNDLAGRLLSSQKQILLERKLDNCGDDGVFEFLLNGASVSPERL